MVAFAPEYRARAETAVQIGRRLPQAVRRSLARRSTDWFCRIYMPHIFSARCAAWQVDSLDDDAPFMVVVWPRFHGKSRLWSIGKTLKAVVVDRLDGACIVSRTEPLSSGLLNDIRRELTENDLLMQDWAIPGLRRETQTELELDDGRYIYAKGIGFQIRGFHPPLAILDDPEDEQSAASEGPRNVLRNWFVQSFVPILPSWGRMVIVGNICHAQCFIQEQLDRINKGELPDWKATVKSAVVWGDGHPWPADVPVSAESILQHGRPAWPDQWTVKALAARYRTVKHRAFMLEYMNHPEAEFGRLFTHIPTYPRDAKLDLKTMRLFMVCDPALGTNEWNSKTAMLAFAVDNQHRKYVLDTDWGHFHAGQRAERIAKMYDRWNTADHPVIALGFESHGATKECLALFDSWCKTTGRTLPLVPLNPENKNKAARLQAFQPEVQEGRFFVRADMTELIDDLMDFQPGSTKSDLADCCGYIPRLAVSPVVPVVEEKEPEHGTVAWDIAQMARGVPTVDLKTGKIEPVSKGGHTPHHDWYGTDW